MKKNYEELINNITGQLDGIKKMMEWDRQCSDIIIQLKAVKSSVSSLTAKYVDESVLDCFDEMPKKDQKRLKAMLKELVNIM